MRRLGLCAIVAGLAAVAGCASGPTFAGTAGILRQDGATLSRIELRNKRVLAADDSAGCEPGSRRSVYTITGDPEPGGRPAVTSALAAGLRTMGYQEAEGPGGRFGMSMIVVRKNSLGITFTVVLRGESPTVEVSGTTDCLTTG